MGNNVYYNKNKLGKFAKFCIDDGWNPDDIKEELLNTNVEDCGLLEFDDNFPISKKFDSNAKRNEILRILRYCYKYNKPPLNVNKNTNTNTKNIRKHTAKFLSKDDLELAVNGFIRIIQELLCINFPKQITNICLQYTSLDIPSLSYVYYL